MKIQAARYGVVTMMCVLAISSMVISAEGIIQWIIAVAGSVFSGILSAVIVPYEDTV